jgi:hypothetical protein
VTATAVFKDIASKLAASSAGLARLGTPLAKVLFFSPADDLLYPLKSISITMERAGFSLAYGTRILGRLRVKGLGRYSFSEEGMPLPESLATSAALSLGRFRAAK